jgi:minimal PKS chain-length factor (CLF/KS beta)
VDARAVFTGMGVLAPNGFGAKSYWDAVCSGTSGIGRISRFDAGSYPAQLAGEISDFTVEQHLPSRLIPQTDRMTQMALVGTDHAFEDAGLDLAEVDEYSMGVMTASTCGGFEFGQEQLQNLRSKGGQYVSAYQSFAWFYAVNTGQITIKNGMRGPSGVIVAEQAGGLDALSQARRLIRNGTDLVLSGGVDASLCAWGWVAQLTSGRLTTQLRPDCAYVPFDGRAAGHVPGEGGALLVLEDLEAATRRGAANIYGELVGCGATFDPRPDLDREPTLRTAIEVALDDAGLRAQQIDVVFADAAGTPELDQVEARAITEVFGARGVPVTAPKSMTGRLGSGAGPLDVATALLSMRSGMLPPTVNVELSPEFDIDLVTSLRRQPVGTALVLARGQGGFNSALVVRSLNQT